MMLFDDGRMKSASYDNSSGFGLRAIAGEAHGYAHSGEMSLEAMRRAAATVSSVTKGYAGSLALPRAPGQTAAFTPPATRLMRHPLATRWS